MFDGNSGKFSPRGCPQLPEIQNTFVQVPSGSYVVRTGLKLFFFKPVDIIFSFEGSCSSGRTARALSMPDAPSRSHDRRADFTPRRLHRTRRLQRRRGYPSRERPERSLRPLQSRGPTGRRAGRRRVRAGNVLVGVRAEAGARHGACPTRRDANAGRSRMPRRQGLRALVPKQPQIPKIK